MRVMKFGGTSVANSDAIRRVAAIVAHEHRARRAGPLVVVSALGGVTDRLLEVAALARSGDADGARRLVEVLRARHLDVLAELASCHHGESARKAVDDHFVHLSALAGALSVMREASPRSMDAVAATGELTSCHIVAAALAASGLPAMAVDPRVVLVAEEIQIWTDVDGMLTADPRVVANPQLVPCLSFGEAAELAYFGAKVLHPKTIQPAAARNIPVRILNTFRPEAPGTLIADNAAVDAASVTALACKKGITVVTITSTGMLMAHGYMRRLFEIFERFRTSVDVVSTSEVSVSVTIDN